MAVLTMNSEGEQQSQPCTCSACNIQDTGIRISAGSQRGELSPFKAEFPVNEGLRGAAHTGLCWSPQALPNLAATARWAGECSSVGAASLPQTPNSGLLFLLFANVS